MSALQITWFGLIGVLLTGYMILDGFDLGVGIWYLLSRGKERSSLISAILPYWDGNEVWLLTGGGAVFAAFPPVYATVFSGLYLALMLVLVALIFRAVSIEFREQSDSPRWQAGWDAAFAFGSIIPALLLGVAAGNILRGLPLDSSGNFTGTFFTLLNPYSLLIGVTGFAMFATHGAVFISVKTAGQTASRAVGWAKSSWAVYLVLYVAALVTTIATQSRLLANYSKAPVLWAAPALALVAILAIGHFHSREAAMRAFLASAAAMLLISISCAAALFPNMVPAINDPALSLTIANSSSSPLTLKTMLILALIGVPIVLVYTTWVHLIFRGKAAEDMGY